MRQIFEGVFFLYVMFIVYRDIKGKVVFFFFVCICLVFKYIMMMFFNNKMQGCVYVKKSVVCVSVDFFWFYVKFVCDVLFCKGKQFFSLLCLMIVQSD